MLDEPNHHSLRLIYGPRVGFDLMSFKVDRDDDLEEFERRVLNYGFPVRRVSRESASARASSFSSKLPRSGHGTGG